MYTYYKTVPYFLLAWADLKTKTKGKHCLIKKYANKTGGGPSCSSNLNEIDEQILALINPTTITGHNNVAESNVDFSFHNDIDISFEIEGKSIKINFYL